MRERESKISSKNEIQIKIEQMTPTKKNSQQLEMMWKILLNRMWNSFCNDICLWSVYVIVWMCECLCLLYRRNKQIYFNVYVYIDRYNMHNVCMYVYCINCCFAFIFFFFFLTRKYVLIKFSFVKSYNFWVVIVLQKKILWFRI